MKPKKKKKNTGKKGLGQGELWDGRGVYDGQEKKGMHKRGNKALSSVALKGKKTIQLCPWKEGYEGEFVCKPY